MIKSFYIALDLTAIPSFSKTENNQEHMMQSANTKQTIGRRELIDFPELGLHNITAKVDTGAYTTALHCHDIREENGALHFKLLDPTHPDYTSKEIIFSTYFQKEIKNSFGEIEKRYIIKTVIRIGRKRIKSMISLTDRGTMRYPVLIGRKLLKNRFVVDVALLNNAPALKKTKK